ncbi:GAF and ANTAR domain-containing protein [Actinoplanes sp. NPDC049118]|uniref:GAF and ANTAR domain-containing protein n=1 Tax=Actinoplanes sp. NPDC049118 TaxID=3155769 RepID=UPI0033FAAFBE
MSPWPLRPPRHPPSAGRPRRTRRTTPTGSRPDFARRRRNRAVPVFPAAVEDRWDGFRPQAVAHGVVSSLSLPLTIDGQTVAALNLYCCQPAAFAGPTRQNARAFAAQCSAALALTLRQVDLIELRRQLLEAAGSRAMIDQAIGILMAQQRCHATAAFDTLRKASQHRNRELRDIAADIITGVTGEPSHPPPEFTSRATPAPHAAWPAAASNAGLSPPAANIAC